MFAHAHFLYIVSVCDEKMNSNIQNFHNIRYEIDDLSE